MTNDNLGDRMKLYEKAFSNVFPIRFPLILRLDGVHFHSNVKRWKCEKPFDENLIEAMFFTAKTLCENISGSKVAYVQSDEITILIRDDMELHSQPWYDKKLNKIMSVAAAKATNAFNWKYQNLEFPFIDADDCDYSLPKKIKLNEMAEFDCRGYILPENEINNAFLWRQQDCSRNSVQMLARAHFSHKQLHKKNNSEIQDMLMLEKGINWNDLPTHLKRGACIIKDDLMPKEIPARDKSGKLIPNQTDLIVRPAWIIDKEIPIFSKEPSYINQFTYIAD